MAPRRIAAVVVVVVVVNKIIRTHSRRIRLDCSGRSPSSSYLSQIGTRPQSRFLVVVWGYNFPRHFKLTAAGSKGRINFTGM